MVDDELHTVLQNPPSMDESLEPNIELQSPPTIVELSEKVEPSSKIELFEPPPMNR
jgi:hypothetical protein